MLLANCSKQGYKNRGSVPYVLNANLQIVTTSREIRKEEKCSITSTLFILLINFILHIFRITLVINTVLLQAYVLRTTQLLHPQYRTDRQLQLCLLECVL